MGPNFHKMKERFNELVKNFKRWPGGGMVDTTDSKEWNPRVYDC